MENVVYKKKRFKPMKILSAILSYLALLIVAFIFVFPVIWLVLASFSKQGSMYSFDGFFPQEYGIDSFVRLFTDTGSYNYPKWFLNTLKIAGFSCLFGTFLTILTAYAMSRLKFKSRKAMMKITLILGMFPSFMGMIAVYLLCTQLGLLNNHWGLILIYTGSAPMSYMVQKGFFDTIPIEIDECAMMHGANKFQVFLKIDLPVAKPMIVYSALTSFAFPWSDIILPQMLLKNRDMWTVAVGLNQLTDSEFSRFAAGSLCIAVPIILLFFFLSKFLVNGMSAGSVKG